jgi:hypothetical protein
MVVRDALLETRDAAFEADLLFLEAWEMFPNMHPGSVLRANQIRRANPGLAAALARELKSARGLCASTRTSSDAMPGGRPVI